MESNVNTDHQPQVQEERRVDAARRSLCLQRHLADYICLWACGEKAEKDEHDPKLSDRLIGWFILMVQGLAYGLLIVLARPGTGSTDDAGSGGSSSSYTGFTEDVDSGGRAELILASITAAIYLLMVSTSHDLRAGFSLLVDGERAGHRAFGVGLLTVYVVMICSALTVLTSTSNDSVSLLLNAVAVLFIADLDEKALKFLSTIPRNWRVFWAIEFIGMSFSLAQAAISSFGDSFPLFKVNGAGPQEYPMWVILVLNPTVVTICSYIFSASLYKWLESCSAVLETVDRLIFSSAITRACSGLSASLQHKKQSIRREPVFYVVLGVWLVHGVFDVLFMVLFPVAGISIFRFYGCLYFEGGSGNFIGDCVSEMGSAFLYIPNAMLVVGSVMKTIGRYCSKPVRIVDLQEPCRSSGVVGDINTPGGCSTESRLPSLLVGLGLGYWFVSILFVMASYWPEGSWHDHPTALSVASYLGLPCFALVSIFMVADTNVFGVSFAAMIKPAVDKMLDRRGIVYWVMMAVFRDALLLWTLVNTIVVINFSV